ncbi:hypothetical protein ACFXG4_50705 [Nocardia sp. NPDC059246]|uniref:hypothetical protein n=1 Tax=unclassified Nocardia TaxID=2637762 RepID=UPI003688FBF6
MIELLDAIASWPTFAAVVGVFGFAPGFVLRLIVQLYPKESPRRRELVAELYAVPRLMRPLFVAEQMETALFEGFSERSTLRLERRAMEWRRQWLASWMPVHLKSLGSLLARDEYAAADADADARVLIRIATKPKVIARYGRYRRVDMSFSLEEIRKLDLEALILNVVGNRTFQIAMSFEHGRTRCQMWANSGGKQLYLGIEPSR